ncbi:MAG: pilus assembly protein TadG-related protein [Actinomycetes bacterium]
MLRGRGGSERGSVAITVALALTLLLGLAALVVDVGLNWAARTSAQTAADSAALAGASRLLVDGPTAAISTVQDMLTQNLVTPGPAGWALDGQEDNGEVVCWTLPDPPPATTPPAGFRCPEGSNALRVITPPIQVQYAFAPVLGKRSNSIKAMAAAAAGPAAPNNCVLCVLEPSDQDAMLLSPTDTGGIHVEDGGIVVNSMSSSALHLLGSGDVTADQIRVLGNVLIPSPGLGQLLPPAELGGPPAVDPLGDLRTPDRVDPSLTVVDTAEVITGNTTLQPGVYRSIDVRSGGVLTLEEGVYVVSNFTGFTVRTGGRVEGTGATIFLACGGYPTPCGGGGARFRLENNGEFVVSPPTTGEYAGLSIFADKGNTRTMRLLGKVTLRGAVYAASGRLIVNSPDPGQPVQINALVAVDRLLKDGAGQLVVDYDPGSPLIGIGRPVLVR